MNSNRLLNKKFFIEDKLGKTPAYYFVDSTHILSQEIIEDLKLISYPDRTTMRVCLHDSIEDNLHNMIIIDFKDNPNFPHYHSSTSESHHIIEGELAVFIFDENGDLCRNYILSNKENIMDRLGLNETHLLIPLTDYVIFHETNKGSFNRDNPDMYIPEWFHNMNSIARKEFYSNLLSNL